MTPNEEPTTEAGRAFRVDLLALLSWLTNGQQGQGPKRVDIDGAILAIESEARATVDVERLARAFHLRDCFPGDYSDHPDNDDAPCRSDARYLLAALAADSEPER